MKFATISIQAIAMFAMISPASASVLYGVSTSGQANYTLPTGTSTTTTGATNNYTTGAFLQQTSYSQPANYGGGSTTTVGNNTYAASAYVLQQTSSFGQLHESVQASASGPTAGASASVSAYIAWLDTITFAGAPVGTQVVIQLVNVYDGSFAISGITDPASSVNLSAELLNQSQNVTLTNTFKASQPSISVTQVGLLTTTVGSVLTLEESLTEYISGSTTFSGSANFANTDSVYLKILTPGITLVSASGANYASPSSVTPEPAGFVLGLGGLITLVAVQKKRLR